MRSLSTLRLTLLRACYLLLVVGLAITYWPVVLGDIATLPRMDGVVASLLSAVGLLAILGLFSPLRMLPLLLFEITWKGIWVLAVAVPKALGGSLDEGTLATLFACAWALPFVVVVPWRQIVQGYFRSAESIRAGVGSPGSL